MDARQGLGFIRVRFLLLSVHARAFSYLLIYQQGGFFFKHNIWGIVKGK